jgi:putative N6-adenine-specific DNA methylase
MEEQIKGKQTYVATTFSGLEAILANELEELGAEETEIGLRAVTFKGDKKILYKANLWCRTALRILVPIKTFSSKDEHELYSEIQKIDWSEYLSVTDTLSIDAGVSTSAINHSKYAALKTKDAIVDQFRDKYNDRPSVDVLHPTIRINIRIAHDRCSLSLDSSGEILYKRGYRDVVNVAPLNEVLAAGMILLSGWDKKSNFVDFMCGSGTLLSEAGLMAKNIPPGIFRSEFGFEKWKDFDKQLWESVLDEAVEKKVGPIDFKIIGNDIEPRAIRVARNNIDQAGLSKIVEFSNKPFQDFTPPEGPGTAIINPPYGERIQPEDINLMYKEVGDCLKKKFSGYDAWILTSNLDAAKNIGLRPTRKIALFNAALECKFLKFSIYDGTKKLHKLEKGSTDESSL